ncbi:MAG: sodium-dependent transporter [Bacillota bacterium]
MAENTASSNKNFGSKFGFIMAAAGSAIGLGNIWNFSYKLGHYGGGAFLLTYLFMVFAIGIVVMIAEMFIGQRSQLNIIESFKKIDRRWMFVGFLGIIVTTFIATYYMVIGGWTIFTAANSFNTNSLTNNVNGFFDFANSGFLPILLAIIFLGLAIAVISLGVIKGIERFSKIVMPVLLVLLLIVMVRSLTLGEGVSEGLAFMFHVDFVELGFEGVLAAMGQAFYSMSLGMGIMITYGSYTKKDVNLAKSAILISVLDTAIALIAGLAIFPAVFAFNLDPTSGIGLMFETIPQVFAAMGTIGMVFSFLFFTLIFIAALTSMVSIYEVVISYFNAKFNISKWKISLIIAVPVCIVGALVSISIGGVMSGENTITVFGNDLLTFFDDMTNKILMPVGVIFTCLAVSVSLKTETVRKEMEASGTSFKLFNVWAFCIKFVTPILVAVVLIAGIIGIISTTYGIFTVSVALGIVLVAFVLNCLYVKKQNSKL